MEEKHEKSENWLAAERFTQENLERLSKDYSKRTCARPPNEELLAKAGDLWIQANEPEKAEQFYQKAGEGYYTHAAEKFESINDPQRAKRFWILAIQNPTGYFDQMDWAAAICWERAGEPQKAIDSYEKAISLYEMQHGSIDLHGDPRPGRDEARILRKEVRRLKEQMQEALEARV